LQFQLQTTRQVANMFAETYWPLVVLFATEIDAVESGQTGDKLMQR